MKNLRKLGSDAQAKKSVTRGLQVFAAVLPMLGMYGTVGGLALAHTNQTLPGIYATNK